LYLFLILNNPVVETVNLVSRSNSKRSTLINSINLYIKNGSSGDSIGRLSSSLLNEESERSSLESKTKLSRGGRRGGVGEDTLGLGELLVYIRDKSSRVTKSVTVSHVVVNELLVSRNVLCSTKVSRGEDLAVRGDLDVTAGADPWFPGSIRKLTSLRGTSVRELVGSIIKSNKNSGTGSVDSNEGGNLVTSSSSDKSGGLGPDSDHGSYCPVVVNDGRSIKRVPAYGELSVSLLVGVTNLRVLLGSSLADDGGVLARFPHKVVSDNIYRKLSISEGIGRSLNGNKSGSQSLGDISTGFEHVLDDSLDLVILAFRAKDIIKRSVTVLLLSGGVERSGGSSVFSKQLSGGGCWANSGGGKGSSAGNREEG